jgi:hypothetical protein
MLENLLKTYYTLLIWTLNETTFHCCFFAQCSGNPTYWNTSYNQEKYLADNKSFISSLNILFNKEHEDFSSWYFSVSTFDWSYYVNRLCPSIIVFPLLTAVKMLAIFINNYFVEKVEALVVFFSVYGFLWSFVIKHHKLIMDKT